MPSSKLFLSQSKYFTFCYFIFQGSVPLFLPIFCVFCILRPRIEHNLFEKSIMFLAVTESTFSTGINNKECTVCHSKMYVFFIFEHSWNWDIWTFKWIACQFSWQHFPPLMIHKVIMCPTIDMSYIWWNMILSQISGGLVDTVDPWLVIFSPWLYQGPSMTG